MCKAIENAVKKSIDIVQKYAIINVRHRDEELFCAYIPIKGCLNGTYLGGSGVFFVPLSCHPAQERNLPMSHPNPQEEATRALVRDAQAGNDNAYSELFELYANLIDSVCRSYEEDAPSEQELRSEAITAFWHAICRFNLEQKEVSFGLFARICMANQLKSYYRKWKQIPCPVSLDTEELAGTLQADESSNPANGVVEQEQYLELLQMMETVLSSQERRIWLLFTEGKTASEIATLSGVDKKSVQNAIFRARKKLRNAIPPH